MCQKFIDRSAQLFKIGDYKSTSIDIQGVASEIFVIMDVEKSSLADLGLEYTHCYL